MTTEIYNKVKVLFNEQNVAIKQNSKQCTVGMCLMYTTRQSSKNL